MSEKPLDPTQTQMLSRIAILEFMLSHLFAFRYLEQGMSMDQVKTEHGKVKALLMRQTNPGYDAAQSELITQEMEISMDELLEMIEQIFDRYSKVKRQA